MADAAGLVIALPGLFVTGVQCFEWIRFGREFKQDFATSSVRLQLAQLRLLRWGEAVGLRYDTTTLAEDATLYRNFPADDLETISDILTQIKQEFTRAEKTAQKLQARAANATGTRDFEVLDPVREMIEADRSSRALDSFSRKTISMYRHAAGLGRDMAQRTSWAFYRRSHFTGLIDTVTDLVKDLEDLFLATRMKEMELCRMELASTAPEDLPLLLEAVKDGDEILKGALGVEVQVQGLSFDHVRIEGEARTRLGNEFEGVRVVEKNGNRYTNMVIGGKSVSHVGNKHGGLSILAPAKDA